MSILFPDFFSISVSFWLIVWVLCRMNCCTCHMFLETNGTVRKNGIFDSLWGGIQRCVWIRRPRICLFLTKYPSSQRFLTKIPRWIRIWQPKFSKMTLDGGSGRLNVAHHFQFHFSHSFQLYLGLAHILKRNTTSNCPEKHWIYMMNSFGYLWRLFWKAHHFWSG